MQELFIYLNICSDNMNDNSSKENIIFYTNDKIEMIVRDKIIIFELNNFIKKKYL